MKPFKRIFELSLKQQLILAVILLFEITGTVSLYFILKKKEDAALTSEFIANSKELTASIEKEVSLNLESLNSINAFYCVNESVSREQFKNFNSTVFDRINSIQALEWIPAVKFEDKSIYESMAHKDGLTDFLITERIDGKMVAAKNRDLYYPVFYLEPLIGNESALGFDLGSNQTRLSALQKAAESNKLVSTARITLVQEKSHQKGILVFGPVKKREEVLGFVLGVYRVGDLVTRAIGNESNKVCNLVIFDISAEEGNQLLVQRIEENIPALADDAVLNYPKGLYFEQTLNIADRKWLILTTPTSSYLDSFSNTADLSLIISIILSLGFLYYFYRNFREFNQNTKNQLVLETTVDERTEELQEYAHIVSHDLKSPLRTIDALVNWLKEDNKDKFDKNSLANFQLIESTLEKMELLISDILSYSSINTDANELQDVDLNVVIKNLKSILFIPKNISVNILSKLPKIKGDPVKLQQLFQNLISNAIKFSDKEKGMIEIDVLDQGSNYQFSVKDNGIGIDEKFHDKIFKIFLSLDNNKDSTGIGLAIVKKIVTQFQGKVWVESEVGKGSTFYFTLKKHSDGIS